jgi:hypothetical protein
LIQRVEKILDGIRNGYILFALGLLPHVFGLALIPVSIFYLTLERIFIILWNLQFGRRHRRRLMVAYGLTLALGVAVVGTGFYLASQQLHPLMRILMK